MGKVMSLMLCLPDTSEPRWRINEKNKERMFGKDGNYTFTVSMYKNGVHFRDLDLTKRLFSEKGKSYLMFGRVWESDLRDEHASISRHHALFQFGKEGAIYLYDMSSFGTFVNEKRIQKLAYIEYQNNDMVRFGDSELSYVLHIEDRNRNTECARRPTIQITDKQKEELVSAADDIDLGL